MELSAGVAAATPIRLGSLPQGVLESGKAFHHLCGRE